MRRTSEQVLAEFHRLYDAFERIEDFLSGVGLGAGDQRHLIMTRAQMLGWVAEGKATPSQILSGVREALNDQSHHLADLMVDNPAVGATILSRYHSETGRDFWQDVGTIAKRLGAILRRGRLVDENEARLITDWLADPSQTVLPAAQVARANRLMADFERSTGRPAP